MGSRQLRRFLAIGAAIFLAAGAAAQSPGASSRDGNGPTATLNAAAPPSITALAATPAEAGEGAAADPQASSTNNRGRPAHHGHALRNFLIIFGAGAVLLIALAAAAK